MTRPRHLADVFTAQRRPGTRHTRIRGTRHKPRWSGDLTRDDPVTLQPWDLGDAAVRHRARGRIKKTKPMLVIGSPPCTTFSEYPGPLQGQARFRGREEGDRRGSRASQVLRRGLSDAADSRKAIRARAPAHGIVWSMSDIMQIMMAPGVDMLTMDGCAV